MALRILPFRQYDENDVINLYALKSDSISEDPSADGDNAAGVLVKVHQGNMSLSGVVELDTDGPNRNYLGASYGAPVGRNGYPVNPLTVKATAAKGDVSLGITLRQTLTHDENGEKLLYYPLKKDELQAVLPGETVPVLTKGVVALDTSAFSAEPLVGDVLMADAGGKLKKHDGTALKDCPEIGKVIACGEREAGVYKDQFAGDSGSKAKYFVVKLDC